MTSKKTSFFRLDIYVPETHLDVLKQALFAADAGKVGSYDSCCWMTRGSGQFRPLEGSAPFLGTAGKVEQVPEWKLEMIFPQECRDRILQAIRRYHPYETPAFQYWAVHIS